MAVLSSALLLGLLFALVFIHINFKKNRANIRAEKETKAPKPSGALPFIGHLHLLRGQSPIARILGEMADKYGPIFSLELGSRPALVVSSWEMVKECFTTNDRILATRPNLSFGRYMGYDNAFFALAPYGPYWRDVRKMVNLELLTNQGLEKFKHVRASELDYLIKDLYLLCSKDDSLSTKINLSERFELLTFNIIIRILAGKRFSSCSNDKEEEEDWKVKGAIKKALYLSGVFVLSDAIPFLEWIDIGGHIKAMKQASKELDQVLHHWLEEHIQRRKQCYTQGEADFIDVMLSTLPEHTVLSGHNREAIIKSTTAALILTASESTAETLIWGLSLLLNNPHILKRAQDELDVQVGQNRWVEDSDISKLIYLQAIVKETLRLYPPGPLSGPREASEDCYLGDYFVPKSTRLIVNLWKLHRDSRVWSEPFEFKPERFLDSHANISYKGQNFEYIPFSSGRRMCPAVTYGMQLVQLTLARLIHGFNITTPLGMPVDMSEGLGIALPKLEPLEVLLTPRLPLELYQNLLDYDFYL